MLYPERRAQPLAQSASQYRLLVAVCSHPWKTSGNTATFSPVNLREVQDSLIVEGVQVFPAQRENLPPSRLAEVLCKVDKSFSGS